MSSFKNFAEDSIEPAVRGFLHTPDTSNGHAVALTHGAGFNSQSPLLIALAEIFCAAEFTVLRYDLPFRQARRFGPPAPGNAAHDRAGIKNAVEALTKIVSGRIFVGGHSYGGRQCSLLCAEDPKVAAGLLLLSYPLHPPNKLEQLRTQHLPNLRTPTLFVHGTSDGFGSISEIEQARKLIPAKTELLKVEGAGHDLGFKAKARREDVAPLVLQHFHHLMEM